MTISVNMNERVALVDLFKQKKTFKLVALTHQKMFAAAGRFQCLDRGALSLISFHHSSLSLDTTKLANNAS